MTLSTYRRYTNNRIYLSMHPSIYRSIYRSIYPSIIYLSIHLSIHLSTYMTQTAVDQQIFVGSVQTRWMLFFVCDVCSENAVALNIRREVYAFGMKTSRDETAWTTVWNRYTTDTSPHHKDDLLHALCQTTNLSLIHRPVFSERE